MAPAGRESSFSTSAPNTRAFVVAVTYGQFHMQIKRAVRFSSRYRGATLVRAIFEFANSNSRLIVRVHEYYFFSFLHLFLHSSSMPTKKISFFARSSARYRDIPNENARKASSSLHFDFRPFAGVSSLILVAPRLAYPFVITLVGCSFRRNEHDQFRSSGRSISI